MEVSYLMVEIDDEFTGEETNFDGIKTCLRINVPNVKYLSNRLMQKKT
ncbi:MAG: hypothetical protein ACWIPJ_10675 [Polaribacter sp.]